MILRAFHRLCSIIMQLYPSLLLYAVIKRWVDNMCWGDLLFSISQCWNYRHVTPSSTVHMGVGNLNPDPFALHQALHWLRMSGVLNVFFQDSLLKYNSHNTKFTPLNLIYNLIGFGAFRVGRSLCFLVLGHYQHPLPRQPSAPKHIHSSCNVHIPTWCLWISPLGTFYTKRTTYYVPLSLLSPWGKTSVISDLSNSWQYFPLLFSPPDCHKYFQI